jgi:hypothetical protein
VLRASAQAIPPRKLGTKSARRRRAIGGRLDAESRPTSVRSLGFTARYVAVTVDE